MQLKDAEGASLAKADRTGLMFGALLHDIGKVLYRGSSGRGTHSKLGADFLSEEIAPRKDRGH